MRNDTERKYQKHIFTGILKFYKGNIIFFFALIYSTTMRRCVYLIHVLTSLFEKHYLFDKKVRVFIVYHNNRYTQHLFSFFFFFLTRSMCVYVSCNKQSSYFRYHFLSCLERNQNKKETGTNKTHDFFGSVKKRKFESGRF